MLAVSISKSGISVPRVRTLKKGETLFEEGEAAAHVYQVVSGSVRTSKLLGDGRRHIDAFHLPGESFGLEAGAKHRWTAEALSPTGVIGMRRSDLEELTAQDPAIAAAVLKTTMRSLQRAQDHMVLLGRRSAREKMAAFLLDMAERVANGQRRFELPMRRSDIADHLGLTIETVSRVLTQFVRNGLIHVAGGGWINLRDVPALRHVEG